MEQIVGITRFSYLGLCDWIGAHRTNQRLLDGDGLQARAAYLYDDSRMARRFASFERILLPSLIAQTDSNFIQLILTSPELPDRWQKMLAEVAEVVPQVRIVVSAERDIRRALRPVLRELAEAADRPVVQFRVDDDDALGCHFIARLRRHVRRLKDVPEFAISLSQGLVLRSYDGAPVEHYRLTRGFIGAGVAARFRYPGRSIFDMDHFQLPLNFPAISDLMGLGYLILRWDAADTADHWRQGNPKDMIPVTPDDFAREAAEHFPLLDLADLDFIRTRPA